MEIKTNLNPRMCLLLAGTMALVSSCQDYEPFSDETLQDKAYTHEFVKQFGEIDPDQDWDLFGQLGCILLKDLMKLISKTMTTSPRMPSSFVKTLSHTTSTSMILFLA